jgi:hypothetical protein
LSFTLVDIYETGKKTAQKQFAGSYWVSLTPKLKQLECMQSYPMNIIDKVSEHDLHDELA